MSATIITAEEARALDPALEAPEILAELDRLIREAAAKGDKAIRVPYEMVKVNGYSIEFRTPGVEAALKEAGFDVFGLSEDRQFVDVWMEISWRQS